MRRTVLSDEGAQNLAAGGALLVVGYALAWLCRTYPSRLPIWAPTEFSWPAFLAATCGLLCYVRGVMRSPLADRPTPARCICFGLGVLAAYTVMQTHFLFLAQHAFFINRLQHLVLHHLAPLLIAVSWPGPVLALGAPRLLQQLARNSLLVRSIEAVQRPVPACLLFVGLILIWLVPSVHFLAMLSPPLYAIMNWSMLLDGLLFWLLVLDPRPGAPGRLSHAARLLLIIAVQVPQIAAGALIMFGGHDLYVYYDLCGRLFPAIGAALDQQIGGSIVCFGGGMMSAVAAMLTLAAMWRDECENAPAR
jgi:putative membrane protein